MQVWPEFWNAPQTAPRAARSRSASAQTIIGSLPPSSSTTGVSVSAAAAMTRLPVRTEPVNTILSTPLRTSASPVAPPPVTTWTMSPHWSCSNSSPMARPTVGVTSDGFSTTGLPASSAVTSGVIDRVNG